MLSLLSLIIASGTVLRADTERWEPTSYPDPRLNATRCNTHRNSTLCDPDRILTDAWRKTISDTIAKQVKRLRGADIQYKDEAAENCSAIVNMSGVRIFVILARRINTTSTQNITSKDLTAFGHGLRKAFGLDEQPCRNYILILGVELAKELYVWTGSDLALPKERLDMSLSQYKNMFLERNYMEGLNKIVEEIGNILADPLKDSSTVRIPENSTLAIDMEANAQNTTAPVVGATAGPVWVYVVMIISVIIAIVSLGSLLALLWIKYGAWELFARGGDEEKPTYIPNDGAISPNLPDREERRVKRDPSIKEESGEENSDDSECDPGAGYGDQKRCSVSGISLPRTMSLSGSNKHAYLQSAESQRQRKADEHMQCSSSTGSLV